MTSYVENETDVKFDFDIQQLLDSVLNEVLLMENCPYEAQVNLLVTDNAGIHAFNRKFRNVDAPTDVLSFPMIPFEREGDFSIAEQTGTDCFEPESGELMLGDIILSAEKVKEQAERFGHSSKREFAFLIAHSLLHLCGYDHLVPEEAGIMEQKQELVLQKLEITRN